MGTLSNAAAPPRIMTLSSFLLPDAEPFSQKSPGEEPFLVGIVSITRPKLGSEVSRGAALGHGGITGSRKRLASPLAASEVSTIGTALLLTLQNPIEKRNRT